MTTSPKVFTACALFVLAAPAFADGGGGSGHGDQPAHTTTLAQTTTKTTSTHDGRRTDQTKLNMRQHELLAKVGTDVVGLLLTYTRDLASGNVAGARAITKEIQGLSALLARNGLTNLVANGGFRVTIGKGVGSKVRLHPGRALISARTANGKGALHPRGPGSFDHDPSA